MISNKHVFLALPMATVVFVSCWLLLMGPAIAWSVAADDSYYILESGPMLDGSAYNAIVRNFTDSLEFTGQPRTAAFAYAERRILAMIVMQAAVSTAVAPWVYWAITKLLLIGLVLLSMYVFIRTTRIADRERGPWQVSRSDATLVVFVVLTMMPALVTTQAIGYSNGWLFYPTLSILPLAVFLFFAALGIQLSRLLAGSWGWLALSLPLGFLGGFGVTFAYEVYVVFVPVLVGAVVIQPWVQSISVARQVKARVALLASFLIPFASMFSWARWRISQMACFSSDTCYEGTVIEFSFSTVYRSFIGVIPGSTWDWAISAGERWNREPWTILPAAALIGLLFVLAAAVIASAIKQRAWMAVQDNSTGIRETNVGNATIWWNVVLFAGLAFSASTITAITATAQNRIDILPVPYRTGAIVAIALAFAVVLAVWATIRSSAKNQSLLTQVAASSLAIGLLVAVPMSFVANTTTAQVTRSTINYQTIDRIHDAVARGNLTVEADSLRCQTLRDYIALSPEIGFGRGDRTIEMAYGAFEYYHGASFCSERVGIPFD